MSFIPIPGDKVKGIFHRRVNRFIGEVLVEGRLENVHVANTGRMRELLMEGAEVLLRKVDLPHRKTKFDLLMVYKNGILVSIDSKLPNQLLEKAFLNRELPGFAGFYEVKREVTYGKSRLDLALRDPGRDRLALIEAKCVTLVKEGNLASFPDAPTTRGVKHVRELMASVKEGYRAGVFFIIQREDGEVFTPNSEMDPEFGEAVAVAAKAGVEFYAYQCKVTPDDIRLRKEIPVMIEPSKAPLKD